MRSVLRRNFDSGKPDSGPRFLTDLLGLWGRRDTIVPELQLWQMNRRDLQDHNRHSTLSTGLVLFTSLRNAASPAFTGTRVPSSPATQPVP